MKTEKVVWGLILVFIGSILLLQNFDLINFNWHVIFRFWPVMLILIGANLLFSKDDSRLGTAIFIVLTLLALGFITYKGITTERHDSHWSFDFDDDKDNDHNNESDGKSSTHVFSEEYSDSIAKATLNITGGATRYVLKDTTNSLFMADVKKNFGNYSLRRTVGDSSQVLDFTMKGKSELEFKNKGNKAELQLNAKPVWDINLEMGAGTADFDLSPYKINNLSIEGGAASFDIKLGNPYKTTTVNIETGVSEIDVLVPASAACKINIESGLSSSDFQGFTKQPDGSYVTDNFKTPEDAIILNLEGGLSKFKVQQY